MNLFVVIGDEIATPPLGGSILPGITRETVLTLAREWGLNISERPIAFDEILDADSNGTLREVFGSGTAAVMSSVGELGHAKGTLSINNGEVGPIAKRLYDAITSMQYGTAPDTHDWLTFCDYARPDAALRETPEIRCAERPHSAAPSGPIDELQPP